jgi:hypothetical protein
MDWLMDSAIAAGRSGAADTGRLRQKASEIAAGKSETHCSLCKAFFGFADGV